MDGVDNRRRSQDADWVRPLPPTPWACSRFLKVACLWRKSTQLLPKISPFSRIHILEITKTAPHIWGAVFRRFGVINRTIEPFVHKERRLSTVYPELSTVWRVLLAFVGKGLTLYVPSNFGGLRNYTQFVNLRQRAPLLQARKPLHPCRLTSAPPCRRSNASVRGAPRSPDRRPAPRASGKA